jgi:hypothetical protein
MRGQYQEENSFLEVELVTAGVFGAISEDAPVTITTFPFTLGPFESGAIFFSTGTSSKRPWSGMGATNCSLKAASLLFALLVMLMYRREKY